jgi:hypothetical protein
MSAFRGPRCVLASIAVTTRNDRPLPAFVAQPKTSQVGTKRGPSRPITPIGRPPKASATSSTWEGSQAEPRRCDPNRASAPSVRLPMADGQDEVPGAQPGGARLRRQHTRRELGSSSNVGRFGRKVRAGGSHRDDGESRIARYRCSVAWRAAPTGGLFLLALDHLRYSIADSRCTSRVVPFCTSA